ncbi:Clusterin-associated protein-1-domain-containing protein [Dunaliella salina]|uniref:Clusterin-associated protein-1-domain-containing protein n=1 Tax=Dunaliella salina TaxID=3046 RepID=A0ABQ7H083_DUNSA|nr:Clusterin-associated protein-1-domain-containing protein [Dunaliella salina]|eukprot:KAF5840254.1 Clusterin-associated protein-1-domain-containing protein [Dunaliella salina]
MSFRELRSFTEIMKSLGYPRLISMENFRLPNFELVAECLYWLVNRYYPGVPLEDEISTEADRIQFLQSVAQVMLTKARMKLNIKRLYSADGMAVKELLKVASLLYKATEKATFQEEDPSEAADFSSLKGFNPKEIKFNAAEIIKAGAALYDALGTEPELREDRARAVAGHVDSDFVENSIQEAISQVEDHIRSMEQQLEELEGNETTLDSKIDKKKQELERNEKRLSTLQSVRPAYMDEYERLQTELNGLYTSYLDKFRNLEYLESELQTYYLAEQEKMEAQERRLKKMQKRLAAEELRILRGEQDVDETQLKDYDGGLGPDDGSSGEASDIGDLGSDAGQAGRAGKGVSKDTLLRPLVQAGGGQPQVVGRLDRFDDEEASIDEDGNSDGGEVSIAGDDVAGRGYGMLDPEEDF